MIVIFCTVLYMLLCRLYVFLGLSFLRRERFVSELSFPLEAGCPCLYNHSEGMSTVGTLANSVNKMSMY